MARFWKSLRTHERRRQERWRSTRPGHVKSGRSTAPAAQGGEGAGRQRRRRKGRQERRGSESTRCIDSRLTRGAPRWRTSSEGAAAPRLPLHVRARLHGGLPGLLGGRGWLQRVRRPPGQPWRDALGGVSGASRARRRIAADGVDVSPGVLVRQRLQLRLQRLVHRGTAREGDVEYNYQAERRSAAARGFREGGEGAQVRGHVRNRRGHAHARGRVWVRSPRTASSTTPIPPMRGLDGLWGMYQWLDRALQAATRRASGGAATILQGLSDVVTHLGTGDLTTHGFWSSSSMSAKFSPNPWSCNCIATERRTWNVQGNRSR